MRTLAITQNITLDGAIEMLGEWFDPTVEDPDLNAELMRQSAAEEILLLGRQTFEDFRAFWPKQTDDQTGITDHLNKVKKYVVSSTMTDPEWENSEIITGDPVAAARELKDSSGGDIVVTGSIQLTHTLIAAGVVDELRLFTYPTIQGSGRRLFPDGYTLPKLETLSAKSFPTGITFTAYSVPIS